METAREAFMGQVWKECACFHPQVKSHSPVNGLASYSGGWDMQQLCAQQEKKAGLEKTSQPPTHLVTEEK